MRGKFDTAAIGGSAAAPPDCVGDDPAVGNRDPAAVEDATVPVCCVCSIADRGGGGQSSTAAWLPRGLAAPAEAVAGADAASGAEVGAADGKVCAIAGVAGVAAIAGEEAGAALGLLAAPPAAGLGTSAT